MEALREVARERHDICNIQLPALCQCGPTLWDSHPDTCANNCIFYKNVKGSSIFHVFIFYLLCVCQIGFNLFMRNVEK